MTTADRFSVYTHLPIEKRQGCGAHLLREFKTVEKYGRPGPHCPAFAKKLRRLLGDAIRFKKRDVLPVEEHASRCAHMTIRLDELFDTVWKDKDAKRLVKCLPCRGTETLLGHKVVRRNWGTQFIGMRYALQNAIEFPFKS